MLIVSYKASNHDVAVLEASERRRDSLSQEQRSSELVGHETINEDKHESEKSRPVAQHEEFMTNIKDDRNAYEAPSTAVSR